MESAEHKLQGRAFTTGMQWKIRNVVEDAKESDLCNATRAGQGVLAARSSEQGAGDVQMNCSSADEDEVQQRR